MNSIHPVARLGLFVAFLSVTALPSQEIPVPVLSPCATLSPEGPYTRDSTIRFDASCTESGSDAVESYQWRFSEGFTSTGPVVEHVFFSTGSQTVTLAVRTVDGKEASLEIELTIADLSHGFDDGFEGEDGSLERWLPVRGDWRISDGALGTSSPAEDAWIWAGNPPFVLDNRSLQTFHSLGVVLRPASLDAGDRTAGVALFAREPAVREGLSGYTIEWIESIASFRVSRWDDGKPTVLLESAPDAEELPSEWFIEADRDSLTFTAGSRFFFSIDDGRYRRGHLGLLIGEGAAVQFDQVWVFRGHGDLAILRGDCDGDGETIGVGDAITLLFHNFVSSGWLPCRAACDVNADGDTGGVTDAVMLLVANFIGGVVVPQPHPGCGFTGRESDFELGCDDPSPACH